MRELLELDFLRQETVDLFYHVQDLAHLVIAKDSAFATLYVAYNYLDSTAVINEKILGVSQKSTKLWKKEAKRQKKLKILGFGITGIVIVAAIFLN